MSRVTLPMTDMHAVMPRLNTRVPWFEAVLFAVLLALGWTAYQTYETVNRWGTKSSGRPATEENTEIQEILKLQALIDVKDRYLGLADQLESGLGEMRDSLQNFLRDKDRTEIGRYLRRGQSLQNWLAKQRENQDPRKLQMLREWLATLPPSTNSPALMLDLDLLYGRVAQSYSNYLAAIQIAEGQALTTDLVQQRLLRATEPEQEVLTAAGKSRMQAAAIDAFVDRRPAELARQLRPSAVEDDSSASIVEMRRSLQPVFYALIVLLVVQCALLMVALYGRVVVAPLRQKLIEDNAAIEQQRKLDHFARLATGLAHEIRNPLTAINVRLFTLQKGMSKGSPEHSDAALIRNEIDRLEQTLKNFLKLARPTEPKFAILTTSPIFKEVRELLLPQVQRQAIDIRIEDVTDVRFRADPVQLKQVLINLIHNAADSIGRNGTIILRANQQELRMNGRLTRMLVMEVEDTGPGIVPEVQERLFDPFYSTKENGTGLGLPIAAKIMDQHKGMLDFDTRIGHGTTFRVILPVSQ